MSHTTQTDDLRIHLQSLAARLGKTPTVVDMHQNGDYHPETYLDHYDTWEDALEAAGLDPDEMGRKKIPDRELLADLQRVADDLGHPPSKPEIADHGQYAERTYRVRFGSWNNALEAAMLDTQGRSDKELLDELQRLDAELGRLPKVADMKERGEYGVVTYYRRFGSWEESLEEAGLIG